MDSNKDVNILALPGSTYNQHANSTRKDSSQICNVLLQQHKEYISSTRRPTPDLEHTSHQNKIFFNCEPTNIKVQLTQKAGSRHMLEKPRGLMSPASSSHVTKVSSSKNIV
jgi:hypothetical protein